jgi:hypothetical protein
MELDVDVCLNNFPQASASELAKRFPVEFIKTKTDATYQDVVIRAASESQVVASVDAVIRDFLQSLKPHAEAIRQSQGGPT